MYAPAYVIYEPFAPPILLLSGISTGLGAPFDVNLIGGQLPLVIGIIIVTSVAVPFVLPAIVYAFAHTQFEIPLMYMIFLLSIALFTPLAVGWLTKKFFLQVQDLQTRIHSPCHYFSLYSLIGVCLPSSQDFFIQNRSFCFKLL